MLARTWTKAVDVTWSLFSGDLTLVSALAGPAAGLSLPLLDTQTLGPLEMQATPALISGVGIR